MSSNEYIEHHSDSLHWIWSSWQFFLTSALCLSAGPDVLRLTHLLRHDRGPVPGGNRSAASCLCTVLRRALYHYSTRSPEFDILGNVSEVVTVKPHASTCTLRLQRLLPHPVIDISMVSTIVLPISARSQNLKHLDTRQVQRETLQTSCLCWAWLDSVCYTGLAGFHTQQVYAENSANSCAMARVFTRVHVFTDELKIMFNLSFQFYLWLSIICILDGLASELEGKLL